MHVIWRDFAGRVGRGVDRGLLNSDVGLLRHERNHDMSAQQTGTSVYRERDAVKHGGGRFWMARAEDAPR